jgi:hypothetical protein
MIYKIFIRTSYLVATISIWEIILGFNGDLISLGSLKIRALLAILNCFLGIIHLFFTRKINLDKSDFCFSTSILLMSLISFLWTGIGIVIFNNKYAIADGQGLIASASFLGIYVSLFKANLNSRKLNFVFQAPLILLFSFITILWLCQSLTGFDSTIILGFINKYSNATFIGSENEFGRLAFLNTILLPLSVFIFSIQIKRLTEIKFWIYIIFYIASMLAVGSRGIAISCVLILMPTLLSKFRIILTRYGIIKSLFRTVFPVLFFGSLLYFGIGSTILNGSRFFNENSSTGFENSDSYRYEQFLPLMNGFFGSPIWGNGLGYFNSNYLRSYENPFSYELFFVALLAKIGIIGFMVYLVSLALLLLSMILRAKSISKATQLFVFLSFITTIFQASTNPFLDRQVGLLLLFGPYIYLSSLNKSISKNSSMGNK